MCCQGNQQVQYRHKVFWMDTWETRGQSERRKNDYANSQRSQRKAEGSFHKRKVNLLQWTYFITFVEFKWFLKFSFGWTNTGQGNASEILLGGRMAFSKSYQGWQKGWGDVCRVRGVSHRKLQKCHWRQRLAAATKMYVLRDILSTLHLMFSHLRKSSCSLTLVSTALSFSFWPWSVWVTSGTCTQKTRRKF